MNSRQQITITAALSIFILAAACPVSADPARVDTTWVRTYDHDFYNWADAHIDTFEFPPAGLSWGEILLYYRIGCPTYPGDCDPWDRLGHLRVIGEDSLGATAHYEIARIVTPYDITGGTRPDSCTWMLDVTDYESLLHDTVILRNYIESWMGNSQGWLVTIDFAFIPGYNEWEAYKVVNLWNHNRLVYGNPEDPIESYLTPISVGIDLDAEAVKLRLITTGHGQGNTNNAAEFSNKWHEVDVGLDNYSHYLWRNDCAQNECSPQGGTWLYNRAGWCPGDKVDPWDNDVTSSVTPGTNVIFDYNVQPYENFCRPNNVNCVSGQTCPDCNYNYNGHTEPHYTVASQAIFYRHRPATGVAAGESGGGIMQPRLRIEQNVPNPFNPSTTIAYTIARPDKVSIGIYTAEGRMVRESRWEHADGGTFEYVWDGRDANGQAMPSGIYFFEVRTGFERGARKMVLIQ